MKFTLSALKSWINLPLSESELAEQLTVSGLETIIIPSELTAFQGVVVGQVMEVNKHPNADRLKICKVNCGSSEKSIICGASNVRIGLKVAVAQLGAVLPKDFTIQARSIRGIESEGMLCSLAELGLEPIFSREATETGIWELSEQIPLGIDLWDYMKLGEPSLEVQVPPNRGDCLSMLGIAREIAALNNLDWKPLEYVTIQPELTEIFPITVKVPTACPRYNCRIIRGLNPMTPTPEWILERLWRGGIRSINAIVDIANYILLEWGAPLHAFDANALSGKLEVRYANSQETLCLLTNKTVALQNNTLVIADAEGAQAIAGVMGGSASAVAHHTTDILLESAFFTPEAILGQARYYGLTTDASYRFERGVDPELCTVAIERATELLLSLCGGQAGPISHVEQKSSLPKIPTLTLSQKKLEKTLGIQLRASVLDEGLSHLGFKKETVESNRSIWRGKRPSWRFDLNEEIDLIEEVIRWYGYEHITAEIPNFPMRFRQPSLVRERTHQLRQFLTAQGYSETLNYSFISHKAQQKLDPEQAAISLENPISTQLNVLRTQLWPGLLQTLRYNQNHRPQPYAFFEVGTVFLEHADSIIEQCHVGGIASGSALPDQWGNKSRLIDYFDIKNVVENSVQLLDNHGHYTYQKNIHPALHPGQTSELFYNSKSIGWIGALHPSLYSYFEITGPVYLFEWTLPKQLQPVQTIFKSFSHFPYMRRDLAFWINKQVPFEALQSTVLKHAGSYLKDMTLFDVYHRSEDPTQRSIAIGLVWQHMHRTLTDQEVDQWQSTIVEALKKEWNILMRE